MLDASNEGITDLTGIEHCKYLIAGAEGLFLSNNQITNVDGLSNLTNVETTLDLSGNQISDISGLHSSLNVGRLLLANNKIKDITPLANLEVLWKLDLSNNNIRDISALDPLKEKENPCEIITDGNPIGEPEEDDIVTGGDAEPEVPSESEDPEVPTESEAPELPSESEEPELPSESEEPELPSESEDPELPSESEAPIYNADDFAELIGTQDVVVKPNDFVTITFEKGSNLNDTNGKGTYDFTTTVTTNFADAKLPAFITENSFITKVSYAYSGVLPTTANIQIFVGEQYAKTEVFYFLLNDDNTFHKDEVQKVIVSAVGYITVSQEHCSDYVVTTVNPETLYAATQTLNNDENINNSENDSEPEKDDNVNNSESDNENQHEQDDVNSDEAPKTGDNSPILMLSMMMIFASAMVLFGVKKYKATL